MRFRKKPIVIEAMQLEWGTWNEMCDFAGVGKLSDGNPEGCFIGEDGQGHSEPVSNEIGLWIPTLEGLHLARENDWVIKGIKGELYPCKPDIFTETYELVG